MPLVEWKEDRSVGQREAAPFLEAHSLLLRLPLRGKEVTTPVIFGTENTSPPRQRSSRPTLRPVTHAEAS